MNSGSGALLIIWVALGLLWLFVPFAIFAIKRLLKQLVDEQKRTNELLSGLVRQDGKGPHVEIPEFRPKGGFLS
ncbi:hypothetical protein ACTUVK_000514 [Stenotrophomonas rhizophila]